MPYREDVNERYNQVFSIEYELLLNGRNSENAKEAAERGAQHRAMLVTFDEMYERHR